jgi:hypothetical protein
VGVELSKKKYFPNKQGCKDATALFKGWRESSSILPFHLCPVHHHTSSHFIKKIAKWELCVFVKNFIWFFEPFPKQMRLYFTAIWGKSGFGSGENSGLSKQTKSTIPNSETDYWTLFILYTYIYPSKQMFKNRRYDLLSKQKKVKWKITWNTLAKEGNANKEDEVTSVLEKLEYV